MENKWIAFYIKVHEENKIFTPIASTLTLNQCKKLGGGSGRLALK